MKVAIFDDEGNSGFIAYDQKRLEVLVTFPDTFKKRLILSFFNNDQEFTLPGDDDKGDGKILGSRQRLYAKPVDHPELFKLALTFISTYVDITVDWGNEDNNIPNDTGVPLNISDGQLIKDVVKSIDSGIKYELI